MKKTAHKGKGKQSSVIRPGTGSGHGVKAGSTSTPTSSPEDKRTMGRKGGVKALA